MSAFKGTPGPWEASDDLIQCAAPDMAIGSVFPCDRDGTGFAYGEVTKANARLIAAAPDGLTAGTDLLDVVKAAIRAGDWKVDGACDPDDAIRRMEQFIAKATGEQS